MAVISASDPVGFHARTELKCVVYNRGSFQVLSLSCVL